MTFPGGVTVPGVLYIVGLALLAASSYGLLRWVESSLREPAPAESQAPVLTVDQIRAVRLNDAGLREYVLEAPRLTQLPGQLGTWIERPVLDWYHADGRIREWRLLAERGWVAADNQLVRLDGEVVMTRTAESGKSPATIITRDVLVRPAEGQAETAAPARAVTPGGDMRAIGLRAFLDEERLELLSEVRGVYEPPKR